MRYLETVGDRHAVNQRSLTSTRGGVSGRCKLRTKKLTYILTFITWIYGQIEKEKLKNFFFFNIFFLVKCEKVNNKITLKALKSRF